MERVLRRTRAKSKSSLQPGVGLALRGGPVSLQSHRALPPFWLPQVYKLSLVAPNMASVSGTCCSLYCHVYTRPLSSWQRHPLILAPTKHLSLGVPALTLLSQTPSSRHLHTPLTAIIFPSPGSFEAQRQERARHRGSPDGLTWSTDEHLLLSTVT